MSGELSPTSTLVVLTGLVTMLIALLFFSMLRFAAAAKSARGKLRESDSERVFVSVAMQEVLQKLKAQEQEMSARAHASEHLSEQILNSLTAGLLVVAADGTVRTLNPAGQRLLGIDQATGMQYRTLLDAAPPLAQVIERCLSTGRAIVRRALRIDLDGRVMHLGVTVSPFAGPDAEGVICLFSDLTSVIEMEEQLRLKAALARLGELTGGMAHEFRNGLATIHGYGRLLDPEALPEQYRPYVEGIRQETESMRKVVTNFLNFAKPDLVTLHPVDLRELLERAAEDVLPAAGSREGRVHLHGTFATVPADDVLLRQVFSNLVRNAVEACENAHIAPELSITGGVDEPHAMATVTVEDNGPGIDPAIAERVFEPFFTTKPQGTGLGLALVQKIVVTHNGRVTVGRSERGGASVQVALPSRADIMDVT